MLATVDDFFGKYVNFNGAAHSIKGPGLFNPEIAFA